MGGTTNTPRLPDVDSLPVARNDKAEETKVDSKIDPKLDQFKNVLRQLRENIGSKSLSDYEQELKLAFYKDLDEIKLTEVNDRDELWADTWGKLRQTDEGKAIWETKVEKSDEKSALDQFVDRIENLSVLAEAIKDADPGVIGKMINGMEEAWDKSKLGKNMKFAEVAAFIATFIIDFADKHIKEMEAKENKGEPVSTLEKWQCSMMLKVGEWFMPRKERRERERKREATELKKELSTVINPLFIGAGLAYRAPSVPEYKIFFKGCKGDTDEEKRASAKSNIEAAVAKTPGKEGVIYGIHLEVQKIVEKNKELAGFQFELMDTALDPAQAKRIRSVLAGNDDTYVLAKFTAEELRGFMTAIQKGEGLDRFDKQKIAAAKTAKPPAPAAPAPVATPK